MKIVFIEVKVSSQKAPAMCPRNSGSLLVHVKDPPIDGKANQAVIKLLSDYFEIPKSRIKNYPRNKIKKQEATNR